MWLEILLFLLNHHDHRACISGKWSNGQVYRFEDTPRFSYENSKWPFSEVDRGGGLGGGGYGYLLKKSW